MWLCLCHSSQLLTKWEPPVLRPQINVSRMPDKKKIKKKSDILIYIDFMITKKLVLRLVWAKQIMLYLKTNKKKPLNTIQHNSVFSQTGCDISLSFPLCLSGGKFLYFRTYLETGRVGGNCEFLPCDADFLISQRRMQLVIFTELAHWADSVRELQCPSVCLWRLKTPSNRRNFCPNEVI